MTPARRRLLIRGAFVLALLSTALTLWFGVMTLQHEHEGPARDIDGFKAVAAAFVSMGLWIVVGSLTDRLPKGRPDEWRRRGWGDSREH